MRRAVTRLCRRAATSHRRHQQYSTRPRDYAAAVSDLNTLQSNFGIVQMIRENRQEMNLKAIPEMIEWCQRIGYEPSELDQLNPIHIAGTKGKGSTSSFISSILAQYLPTKRSIYAERTSSDVGLYTSPHLRFVRERIQVNNAPISESDFAACFYDIWDRLEQSAVKEGKLQPHDPKTKPVYFRYLTLMALHHYMQNGIGTAVIECGIGGEYDSTNILVKPSITGITSLGIDHTAILGESIDSIAWHKAGIFKPGVPAFTIAQPVSADKVLHARARERGTELQVAPIYSALDTIKLGLFGEFQKFNAALAVAIAAAHLQKLGYTQLPDPMDREATLPQEFITGLEQTRLGGRCETRSDSQNDRLKWHLDGAHTQESVRWAAEWFASETSERRFAANSMRVLIFNQQTRDSAALVRTLYKTLASKYPGGPGPFDRVIFCTNTTYKKHGYKADLVSINVDDTDVESLKVQNELAKAWAGTEIDGQAKISVCRTIEEAMELARDVSQGGQTDVFVTGSLHLVGGAIEILENEHEESTA